MYTTREMAWCKINNRRQMCTAAAASRCCCCCCCCCAAATTSSSSEVEHLICTAEGGEQWENHYPIGGGRFTKKDEEKGGVVHVTYSARLGEAESNPLFFGVYSATFNAPSNSTVLGRNPDMRRNIPTAPLLAPQPKLIERTLGFRREACLKTKKRISYIYILL